MWESIVQADQELSLFLNGLHSPFTDNLMLWITGRMTWIPLYLLLIFWIFRSLGWKKGLFAVLTLAAAVGLSDFITSGLMKPHFERLRPCHNMALNSWLHTVGSCGGQYGFASSHAANTFALFAGIRFLFPEQKKIGIALLFWAIIVSYSRIYVGVHFLGDILVGALIGFTIAAVLIKVFHLLWKKTHR
ncbi:phosphatase PAP2 family protein [Marinilongibacter aquaticus]|uniref:phosphatase PAP2 family protein n=1 Tax=Marinilongibacter aquaticus TaxID=2975157 RepID=UPI0021BDE95C|nr:phosphatase PAP2 family protein [Marinilongibacter aquaticus]UBM58839.1 phosphatase PAP2 family protein [Marinilongibacter aquaticus]